MSEGALEFGPGRQTRLRFWSANMDFVHSSGMSWPGFSYTAAEKERMAAIAATLPRGTFALWFYVIGPIVFILLAAAVIVGLWLPAMDLLFPNPADVRPLPFVLLLAASALLALCLGFWAILTAGRDPPRRRRHGLCACRGRRRALREGAPPAPPHDPHRLRRLRAGLLALDRLPHRRRPDRDRAQMGLGRDDPALRLRPRPPPVSGARMAASLKGSALS